MILVLWIIGAGVTLAHLEIKDHREQSRKLKASARRANFVPPVYSVKADRPEYKPRHTRR